MKKKWLVGLIVAATVLLAMVIILRSSGRGVMPVYQGRTAEAWLGEVFTTNQAVAMQAFRTMGTNALPVIVHAFEKRDSAWDKFYQKNYPKLPAGLQKHLTAPLTAEMKWSAAEMAFWNIGQTSPAMPALARMLEEKNNPANAVILPCFASRLNLRETNYIPLLIECLSETNANERVQAAFALGRFGPLAKSAVPTLTGLLADHSSGGSGLYPGMEAAYALWQINGQTNVVTKMLRENLADGDSYTRNRAAVYLSEIYPSDLSLIPIIIGAVANRDPFLEMRAVEALKKYGSEAKEFAPELIKILDSKSYPEFEERQIWEVLNQIDPEAATKHASSSASGFK